MPIVTAYEVSGYGWPVIAGWWAGPWYGDSGESNAIFSPPLDEDLSIIELAKKIAKVVGFQGEIVLDTSKPDGTPRKWVLSEKLFSLGWRPSISLSEGIALTYRWYMEQLATLNQQPGPPRV